MLRPQLRRKRERKTHYFRRLRLLKGGKPRLVVRLFSRSVVGMLVEYKQEGDAVRVSFNSKALEGLGWKHNCGNLPAAYLTGYAVAKKGVAAGIKEAVFDLGFHPAIAGTRPFAFLKGALDGGLQLNVAEEMLPPEERFSGKHIADYAAKASKPQFSKTGKGITEDFKRIKDKIK